ncbi:MAG: hypothetical protein VX370_02515 [Bacteroidota bacterium]|nr:hypothetical protein [Bacteroidota bacterium]
MKKILLVCMICVFFITNTSAQQGNVMIGAQLSDISRTPVLFWNLTPTVAYFLSDQLCVGLALNYSLDKADDLTDWSGNEYDMKTDTLVLSPFIRYYMSERMFMYSGIGLVRAKREHEFNDNPPGSSDDYEEKRRDFMFMLGVGSTLMWGDHFCFEPTIGITHTSGSMEIDYEDSSISDYDEDSPTKFKFGISLGIAYKFDSAE